MPLERRHRQLRDSDLRTDGSHGSTIRPPRLEDFGQLVDNGILRRIAPVVLEIVDVWWQCLTAIFAAKTLCDLFLGQSRLFAGIHGYLTKRLHIDESFLTLSLYQSESDQRIWDISRAEFVLSAVATLGVATIGVLPGIALAIALSVALLLVRASSPHDAILGQVPGVDGFTDISEYAGAQTIAGVLIYRFDAALLFFNADYFKRRVRQALAKSAQPVQLFIFDMEAISVIDITGLEALEEVRSELASKGTSFVVARAKAELREHLVRAGSWDRIGAENFHPSVRSAVQFALNE
jgi:hypothetical protein